MTLRTRIGGGFATALLAALLIGAADWLTVQDLTGKMELLDRTVGLLGQAERVRELMADVEAGAGGFLLSGHRELLDPYQRAARELPADLSELERLSADDPGQSQRAARILELATRYLALRTAQVDARLAAAGAGEPDLSAGAEALADFRLALTDLRAAELHRLAQRTAAVDAFALRARTLLVVAVVALGALLLLGTVLIARSVTGPLSELAAAADRIGKGEPTDFPSAQRTDEVGTLARALQRMSLALSHAEARSMELLADAPEAFFLADLEGRYLDVNRAACQLLGYSREELLQKRVVDLLPPEDAPRLAAAREALLVPGAAQVAEWTLLARDGTPVAVEISARILSDGRWQAFVRDVRERRRAEEHARHFQEHLDGIVSTSPNAVVSVDETQRLTLVNEAAERLFGWSEVDLLGKPLDLLIPERFQAAHREHLRGFAQGEVTARAMGTPARPVVGRRRNGEEFPAEAAISRTRLAGRLTYNVILRDVSEERRRERQQAFLTRVGAVFSSSLAYQETLQVIATELVGFLADFCALDLVHGEGFERAAVAVADPARAEVARQLQAYPMRPERLAKAWPALAERRTHLHAEVDGETLRAGAVDEQHHRLLEAMGIRSSMAVPLLARGGFLGYLSLASTRPGRRFGPDDVQLAEEVARRAALAIDNARLYRASQEAIRARDDVLHVVAHDLRNPLNAAHLQASALLRRKEEERRQNSRRAVDAIRTSLGAANRLIEDLLDVARAEQGAFVLHHESIAPGALVDEAVQLLAPVAHRAEIALEVSADCGALLVRADRDRAVRVLANLLQNAVKFSPHQTTVRLRATPREKEVCFSVTDAGPGIAPEHLPRVFERFWQQEKGRQGLGLGLSIAKVIVEQHGGTLWAESTPGQGSTFSFTLPLVDGVHPMQHPTS